MENSLESIREELLSLADLKYKEFQEKLLPGTENLAGVRLPMLRRLAKKIAKEWGEDYLKSCFKESSREELFEEIMLQGMVIGYMGGNGSDPSECRDNKDKMQVKEPIILYTEQFLPKIDNWSVCDSFCSGFKYAVNHQEEVWRWLNGLLASEKEFTVRYVIVMLLNYYINDTYIDCLYPVFDGIRHEGYYVKMAAAWAVSICYIKYPEKTKKYLDKNQLDDFTYNKALQKIIESRCISTEEKEKIREIKNKGRHR